MNHRIAISFLTFLGAAGVIVMVGLGPVHAEPSDSSTTQAAGASANGSSSAAGQKPAKKSARKRNGKSKANNSIRPWAKGVPQDRQNQALALYEAGNKLLADGLWGTAAARYREALRHWNHPGIHYNLMIALVSQGQPVEAYESSIEALRYGAQALQPEEYSRAQDYNQLLRQQVAEMEIVCDLPGAIVTLDGKALFTGPGKVQRLVEPGTYLIVAQKEGFQTLNRAVTLSANNPARIELQPARKGVDEGRRWHVWKPWAVVGTGFALSVFGAVMHERADDSFLRYDDQVLLSCKNGCDPVEISPTIKDLEDRARTERALGTTGYVLGAALAGLGVYLVYANRLSAPGVDVSTSERQVSVTPVVSPTSAGVFARMRF